MELRLHGIFEAPENQSPLFWGTIGMAAVCLFALVDSLYEVKKSTKNNARFMTWEGNQSVQAPLNLRRSAI